MGGNGGCWETTAATTKSKKNNSRTVAAATNLNLPMNLGVPQEGTLQNHLTPKEAAVGEKAWLLLSLATFVFLIGDRK